MSRTPTREERLRPLELLVLAGVMSVFTGVAVLLSIRDVVTALLWAGVAFIGALVVLALITATTPPKHDDADTDDAGAGDPTTKTD